MEQPENRRSRRRWNLVVLGAVLLAAGWTARSGAMVVTPPLVRGEFERLLRQAYDYTYRNSNRNVFRSSRHFHPTRNIFRSSRHYQQRLAASFDGYPLRTTVRYGHDGGRGRRGHSFTFVTPRRYPQGPIGYGYDAFPPARYGVLDPFSDAPEQCDGTDPFDPHGDQANDRGRFVPRTRSEIPMVPISLPQREPTQTAVLRTIRLADGTERTVITSEPIETSEPKEEGSLDKAWKLLSIGDYNRASQAFLEISLDGRFEAEAALGYGLGRALGGEEQVGRRAVSQALSIEPGLLDRLTLEDSIRGELERLLEHSDPTSSPKPDAADG